MTTNLLKEMQEAVSGVVSNHSLTTPSSTALPSQKTGSQMTLAEKVHSLLAAPFEKWEEKTRQGPGGKQLSYVTARAVMRRLDEIVGPDGWQSKMVEVAGNVACELSVRYGDRWVTKTDGAGETTIEGDKGAFSDAFKRAAVHHGIARYLYNEEPPAKREKAPPLKDSILANADRAPNQDFDEAEMQMRRLLIQLDNGEVDIDLARVERDEILMAMSKEEKKNFWFERFKSGERSLMKQLKVDW